MMNSRATNSAAIRRGRGHGARHACSGFTIVEFLIAMAVLMIVSAMIVPKLVDAIKSARNARAVADVRTIGTAALGYYAEYGTPPNTLADIGYDQQLDPWGRNYQYLGFTASTDPSLMRTDRFGVPINRYFDIYSMGPDRVTTPQLSVPPSQDDVIWANDGIYMGLASDY